MEFFVDKKIRVSRGEEDQVLTLRPLYIREIPALLRLMVDIDEMEEIEQIAAQVEILRPCITPAAFFDSLPAAEVLPVILDAFFKLNFGADSAARGDGVKAREVVSDRDFAGAMEFLISQGHSFKEIQDYTLPQFKLFQELAVERLTNKRKKKVDPLAALVSAGIPIGSN